MLAVLDNSLQQFSEHHSLCMLRQFMVTQKKTIHSLIKLILGKNIASSVRVLHEQLNGNNPNIPYFVQYTDTKLMVADLHTKGFPEVRAWTHAHTLGGSLAPDKVHERIRDHCKYIGVTKLPKPDAVEVSKGDQV